jgi:hypothetical protein
MRPFPSEAKTEEVSITDVDQDCMGQHVSTDKTLYVLPLKRCLKHCSLDQNIVRKEEPHKIFITGHVSGRWRVNVGDANRVKAKLGSQAMAYNASACAGVDHRYGWDGRRYRGARPPKSVLNACSNSNPEINDWSDILEIRDLRYEGRHVRC